MYIFHPKDDSYSEDDSTLVRPTISWGTIIAKILLHVIIGLTLASIANVLVGTTYAFAVSLSYYCGCIFFMRSNIVIWMILLYQLRAPSKIRMKCGYKPSCSEYMILAIQKKGLLKGVKQSIQRLRVCSGPPIQVDYP